ncbi:MAG: NAD(P)H-hydrate dehydratase [Acidobacteria bacterium]|nr:NAD(P)H-hydrate dehydratase [Acidobacteriota bacterium]
MRPLRVLNARQMRAADRRTIDDVGIGSIVLMENAGRQVVAALETLVDDLPSRTVAILCGTGNNGGDGFVVARSLRQRGLEVVVFLIGTTADVRGDARINLDVLGRLGTPIVEIAEASAWELHGSEVTGADLIVDAIVGTGLSRPLSGLHETIVADVNASGTTVVAIDLPSGLSADAAEPLGPSLHATVTVTLGAPKVPLVLPPAEHTVGDVVIADIGIPAFVLDEVDGPRLFLLTREYVRTLVPTRSPDAHKGDFGRVVIVAGSLGMTGAAALAARAALRAGAGLVTVATPHSVQPVVAGLGSEFMTVPLADDEGCVAADAVDRVLDLHADVVAIGPGLGAGPGTGPFVRAMLERCEAPLILDADALNACAGGPAVLVGREERPVVITPHPGEMARLLGCATEDVQANRVGLATEFAARHGVTVVLKGYRTIIATPSGDVFVNPTGSPGMATAGSGDVLTGMVAAALAQLLDAATACQLATYLHGAAGELADADEGEMSMVAGDIVSHIGDAVQELAAREQVASRSE